MSSERIFSSFKELNAIPRPSHHEEKVADFLCQFAERLNLEYERDPANCVVIRKPATPGHEDAEPIVLLNHMDMVCVGMDDPENTPIDAYIEDGWMKAHGTSLGADNGIGLSMALAVLEHPSSDPPLSRDVRLSTSTQRTTTPSRQVQREPVCSSTRFPLPVSLRPPTAISGSVSRSQAAWVAIQASTSTKVAPVPSSP